jgi:hypothetical protein
MPMVSSRSAHSQPTKPAVEGAASCRGHPHLHPASVVRVGAAADQPGFLERPRRADNAPG